VRTTRELLAIRDSSKIVDELGAQAVDAALAGADIDPGTIDGLVRDQSRTLVLSAAIDDTRRRRASAIADLYSAEAEALRGRAAKQHTAATEHEARTVDLLAAVSDHEGGARYELVRAADVPPGIAADPSPWQVPTSMRMRRDVDRVLAEADRVAGMDPLGPGGVDAEVRTVAEVVDAVAALDPSNIGPRLDTVADWAAVHVAPLLARLARGIDWSEEPEPVDRVRVALAWTSGQVTSGTATFARHIGLSGLAPGEAPYGPVASRDEPQEPPDARLDPGIVVQPGEMLAADLSIVTVP